MELPDRMLVYETNRDELCHKCGDLIPIGSELVLDTTVDPDRSVYFHVKCSGLCEVHLAELRADEAEFREYDDFLTDQILRDLTDQDNTQ